MKPSRPHAPEFAPENLDAPHVPESIILPSQWRDLSRTVTHAPELRLLRAVLDDALYCLMSYAGSSHTRAQRLFTEAYEWVMSDDDHYLYSFCSICSYLDIDANYLRPGIQRWLAQRPCGYRRRYDLAYQKKTHVHFRIGRPSRENQVAWQQKVRGCEQWRVYLRTPEGHICVLGSYETKNEAWRAVRRIKENPEFAFQKALAKKEAQIEAA